MSKELSEIKEKRKKEDPAKVYDRQVIYRDKIEKIEVTPLTLETKTAYKKNKKRLNLSHEQILILCNSYLDILTPEQALELLNKD